MLSPEVLNFREPQSKFVTQKANENLCLQKINQFNYSHLVTVVLPDTLKVPEPLGSNLSHCDFYKINKFKPSSLIDKTFIHNFISCGNLNLLSINSRIDCDNCLAVTSCGKIVLNLNKVTFQSLGLEGTVSYYSYKNREKFVVLIDLKCGKFQNGKNFERAKNCLSKLSFDVIFSWDPPDDICPSSVAKYFFDHGYDVHLSKIKTESNTIYSTKGLSINFDDWDQEDVVNFAEWLGMVTLNCYTGNEDSTAFVNSYVVPEPSCYYGQVKVLKWRGFFSSRQVEDLFHQLKVYNNLSDKLWVAIYVQGFTDAPITWNLKENHYYTDGDNGYIILFNKKEYLFSVQTNSNKRYK